MPTYEAGDRFLFLLDGNSPCAVLELDGRDEVLRDEVTNAVLLVGEQGIIGDLLKDGDLVPVPSAPRMGGVRETGTYVIKTGT